MVDVDYLAVFRRLSASNCSLPVG